MDLALCMLKLCVLCALFVLSVGFYTGKELMVKLLLPLSVPPQSVHKAHAKPAQPTQSPHRAHTEPTQSPHRAHTEPTCKYVGDLKNR